MTRTGQIQRLWRLLPLFAVLLTVWLAPPGQAAPYAAMVIDARDGKVLHARNADTRLHPASLTKMMTLYIAFEAVQNGELTMDTPIRISRKAAAEPPSKLGLRAGQTIALRYLVRAAAVKSANDAATAIAEGISGSEAAFARRMNRTAQSLGMTRTTFKNAHGLTESGHLSTARDMTTMGRALFYHYPQYYNLFSRRAADAQIGTVYHTNRRFLAAYRGADGIKTGYTRAAGFNLTSSAERNGERIIATVFGGNSTASRNARMAELLDMGFERAPRRVAVNAPARPAYRGNDGTMPGRTIHVVQAVARSLRPMARPLIAPPEEVLVAMGDGIEAAVAQVAAQTDAPAEGALVAVAVLDAAMAPLTPEPRPAPSDAVETVLRAAATETAPSPDVTAASDAAPQQATESAAVAQGLPIVALSLATAPEGVRLRPEARPAQQVAAAAAPDPERTSAPMLDAEPSPEQPAGQTVAAAVAQPQVLARAATQTTPRPTARPPLGQMAFATAQDVGADVPAETRVVTRVSTSGGRLWRVSLGAYPTRFDAEKALLEAALRDMSVLDGALRKVVRGNRGFEARFLGLTETQATRTCDRMAARGTACEIGRAG